MRGILGHYRKCDEQLAKYTLLQSSVNRNVQIRVMITQKLRVKHKQWNCDRVVLEHYLFSYSSDHRRV